jgi:hypothetical protein
MNLWVLDVMIKERCSMENPITALNSRIKRTFFQ